MKYLDQLSFDCEGVLEKALPDRFGILFDGWDDDGNATNFLGIFVTWFCEKQQKVLIRYVQCKYVSYHRHLI